MKILYFGTICNIKNYEKILGKCERKPTVATNVFENALIEGMCKQDIDIDIFSYPMIPTFKYSKLLCWGRKRESLECGIECNWLRTINISFLKQISRNVDGRIVLKKWINKYKDEDCMVISYGIPPFFAKDLIRICRTHNVKSCAIVPDLPRDMYMNTPKGTLKSRFRNLYLRDALKVQGEYDGYIYLTENMSSAINREKPYIVIEGILNETPCFEAGEKRFDETRGIMYAGSLNINFGIMNLIDAFELAQIPNTELWLFGDGDATELIKERAKRNVKVRLFGRRNRDEIIDYEKKATLLVNPRSTKDEYTRYSFPSKTIEYMYSGTPLLTTKLEGIPEEYFQFVFVVEDNDVALLTSEIQKVFELPEEKLAQIGAAAKNFIKEKKNAEAQTTKIIDFLKEICSKSIYKD